MSSRSPELRWLATPENGAALAAVREIVHAITNGSSADFANRVYLHGATGAGKTALVRSATRELTDAGFDVRSHSANDFAVGVDLQTASEADLLIVEDLQHLPVRFSNPLIALIDHRDNH